MRGIGYYAVEYTCIIIWLLMFSLHAFFTFILLYKYSYLLNWIFNSSLIFFISFYSVIPLISLNSVISTLYGHRPPITKTIKVRRTRHAGHYWRSKDELISVILKWTPSHGQAKAGRPARSYIQQLCTDTGYSLEDLPGAVDDRDGWRERVREIRC